MWFLLALLYAYVQQQVQRVHQLQQPPADFSTALTDNTAVWKKLGFLVNTGKGRVYFTPQDIIKISQEVAFILNEALTKYDSLKTQIAACKTQADLDRIIWS